MADELPGMLSVQEGYGLDDVNPSWGLYAATAFKEGWQHNPTGSLYRMYELNRARSTGDTISADDAQKLITESGTDVKFSGNETKESLNLLIDRERARRERQLYISRYDPGYINQLGMGLIAGATDPINIAASFTPVISGARYGKMLSGASGMAGRTAIRGGVGAVEGMVGMAAVEPLNAFADKQEGLDYGMDQFLTNVAYGSILGAGLHTSFGAIGEVLHKFPYATKKAGLETAISDVIAGEPVRSGDILAHRTDLRALPAPDWKGRAEVVPNEDGMTISIRSGNKKIAIADVVIGEDGKTATIPNISVDQQYRGNGVATAIYDLAKEKLAERGLRGVRLMPSERMNESALGFWSKYDPNAVRDDVRLHKNEIRAYAEDKYGPNTDVEFWGGNNVLARKSFDAPDEAADTKIGYKGQVITKEELIEAGVIPKQGELSKYYTQALEKNWAGRDVGAEGIDPKVAARNKIRITEDVANLRAHDPQAPLLEQLANLEKHYDPAIVHNMINTGWARVYLDELRRLSSRNTFELPKPPSLPEGFRLSNETPNGYTITIPSDNPASPLAKAVISLKGETGEVGNIWVRDDVRRQGIARSIYDYVDRRLASEGKSLTPSTSLKEAGFEFWSKYRPKDVAHDLRANKDLVEGYAKEKFGEDVTVAYREGGSTATVFRDGRSIGDITSSELWDAGIGLPKQEAPPLPPKQRIQEHIQAYAQAMSERLESSTQALEGRLRAYRDQVMREDVKPEPYQSEFAAKSQMGDPETLQHVQKIRAETEKRLELLPKEKADAIREEIKALDEGAADLEAVIGRVAECFFAAGA